MKTTKYLYKNSSRTDFLFNLVLIVISALLCFMAAKFFNNKISIIVYALSIACAYCKIAVEAIEKLIAKKFDSDIISTLAILIIFASQEFLTAAVISVIYAFCKCIFDLINSDFSEKVLEEEENRLKYSVTDDNSEKLIFAEDLKEGDKIRVNKDEYLAFSYFLIEENGVKKYFKAGKFSYADEAIVTVIKTRDYEIDFMQMGLKESVSKAEKVTNTINLVYTISAILFAVFMFVKTLSGDASLFKALYVLGMYLLFANPLSINSGIINSGIFTLISLKKKGIFLKDTSDVEKLSRVKKIFFTKTGVVTNGDISLSKVYAAEGFSENEILKLAAIACSKIENNPLTKLFESGFSKDINDIKADNIEIYDSLGVIVYIEDKKIYFGSSKFMIQNNIDILDYPEISVYVAVNERAIGALALKDTINNSVLKAVKIAEILKIETELISGDCENTVKNTADLCGFSKYQSLMSDEDKKRFIAAEAANKTIAFVNNTEDFNSSKKLLCISTSDNADNIVLKNKIHELVKSVKSTKLFSFFVYLRTFAGVLVNLAIMAVFASGIFDNYFRNILVATDTSEGAAISIKAKIIECMLNQNSLAPWIIAVMHLCLIILFLVVSFAFLNNNKKLR